MSWSLPLAHEPFSDRRAIAPAAHGRDRLQEGVHVPAETSRRLACDASRVVMWHPGRRADPGRRPPHTHNPARAAPRPAPPRSRLPLSRLRRAHRPGSPPPPLGQRRPHDPPQPRPALPPPPPRRARGGLPGRPRARRPALLPEARRAAAARRPASGHGVRGSSGGAARAPSRPGLDAPPRTACPTWCSAPLDLGWAIDVLHPLADPQRGHLPVTAGSETAMAPGRGADAADDPRRASLARSQSLAADEP
jgi:hypothetical protein